MLMTMIFALAIAPLALASDLVPVFVWDSARDGSSKLNNVPFLSKVSKGEFRGILQEKLKHSAVVLVFAEENLSIEDLSWQDGAGHGTFPHLHNLSRSGEAELLYLPFVDSPLEVLKHMFPANHPNWNEASVGPEGIPILSEDTPDSNNLWVNLKDAKDNDDRPDLLKRHDSIIADIYKSARQRHNHVVTIYTAHHSSWHVEGGVQSRRARDLPEGKDSEDNKKEDNEMDKDEENIQNEEVRKEEVQNEDAIKSDDREESASESPIPSSSSAPEPEPPKGPPFMTIPILSGLMVSSILLAILGVAVSAIMEIKPTLRFDDPKGKALTFAAAD